MMSLKIDFGLIKFGISEVQKDIANVIINIKFHHGNDLNLQLMLKTKKKGLIETYTVL